MDKKKAFFMILLLWVVLSVALIGYKQYTVSTGEKILLKTIPVDPRDILRGDYVVLNYEISRIDIGKIRYDGRSFSSGDTFYLTLRKADKYWVPEAILSSAPKGDVLFIKGTVKSSYSNTITVAYGIENYFVPEGRGIEIERNLRVRSNAPVDVEVSVDNFGNAIISRIFFDGVEMKFK